MMKPSDNCEQLVAHYEGVGDGDKKTPNLDPYICPAGVGTLGLGHALYHPVTGQMLRVKTFGKAEVLRLSALAVTKRWGRPWITLDEAYALLEEDLTKYSTGVSQKIGSAMTSQSQFDAMVSFAFNVGLNNFATSSVLKYHLGIRRPNIESPNVNDLHIMEERSKLAATANMTEAFCAWAKSDGNWTLGLFNRRWTESRVYFGHGLQESLLKADSFRG